MLGKVLLFGSGLVPGTLGAVRVCRPDLLETRCDAQDLPDADAAPAGNAGNDGQGPQGLSSVNAAPDEDAVTPLSDVDKGEREGLLSAFPSAPKAESCLPHTCGDVSSSLLFQP